MQISKERENILLELEKNLNYTFKDKNLLNVVFVHRSYLNENKDTNMSNERLEFLGDIILGFIFSTELFKQFPNENEGFLTKLRSKVVCEDSFAHSARELNLGRYLLLGKGEDHFGGRDRNSILADTFEALFGALYLDGGLEVAINIVKNKFFDDVLRQINQKYFMEDYKSKLQEYFHKNTHHHKKFNHNVKYVNVKEIGPDHDKQFFVSVCINGKEIGYGSGKNKKQAEQHAAKDALLKIGVISE